jgi:hypothetical protein
MDHSRFESKRGTLRREQSPDEPHHRHLQSTDLEKTKETVYKKSNSSSQAANTQVEHKRSRGFVQNSSVPEPGRSLCTLANGNHTLRCNMMKDATALLPASSIKPAINPTKFTSETND